MAMAFRRYTVYFDWTKGITQSEPGIVTFNQNVIRADVPFAGFDVFFTEHTISQVRCRISAPTTR